MLNPHEKKVVAADPELPGLRAILDDEAALEIFAEHVPGLQPMAACCTYLRYKPHTSCLATFTVDTSETQQTFHLVAYRSDASGKLAKANQSEQTHDVRCPTPIVVPKLAMVIFPFPYDRELSALERVATHDGQLQLLSRLAPDDDHEILAADWTTLRYKHGRRFVARLDLGGLPQAVLKLHSEQVYTQSRRAAKSLTSLVGMNTARTIGHTDRYQAVLHEWLAGESLASLIAEQRLPSEVLYEVGRQLARLHAQQITKLPLHSNATEAQELDRNSKNLAAIFPAIERSLSEVSHRCASLLTQLPTVILPIHGDCHPQQIIVNDSEIALIDFDSAALGHPTSDLGNFLAHVGRDVLQEKIDASLGDQLTEELIAGYSDDSSKLDLHAVQTFLAAGLLRLAHEPFRYRQQNWPAETEKLVERATQILDKISQRPTHVLNGSPQDVAVSDPFSVNKDNRLPNATTALDPHNARQTILPVIRRSFDDESLALRAIRVLRHKPGRRCLIEYACVSAENRQRVTVLGKIHAKSRHERSFRLQQALWESGFDYESTGGISVARPVGIVSEYQLWLQERVPGIDCWDALAGPHGETVAARIADAAHQLHQTEIVTERVHTIADELQILEAKLPYVARLLPRLKSRIDAVLQACRELASSISSTPPTGIHRDFYPDQILVDNNRLYVLDHDLYCLGDPCLDIGNFCGHLIEHSLRVHDHPEAYAKSQHALVERFCLLRNDCNPTAIDAYTTLTVARHIFLSTRIAGRRSSTNAILTYCETALSCLTA